MNKNIILNSLCLVFLMGCIVVIIIAIAKPEILSKIDKKNSIAKNKQGFIKYNQIFYTVFGLVCGTIAVLSLLKIIDRSIFGVGVSTVAAIAVVIDSRLSKEYI